VSATSSEPIDAIAYWFEQNSVRAAGHSVELDLQQGHSLDRLTRKVILSMDAGEIVALVEAWPSGEMVFTLHDFSRSQQGHIEHICFGSFHELLTKIEACYVRLVAAAGV
jgi:hypothetical protein